MDDFYDYLDYEDYEALVHVSNRDNHGQGRDFFEELTELEFYKHFRFDKEGVRRILGLLEGELAPEPNTTITVETQV